MKRVEILLVDDEALVRQGIASLLSSSGWVDVVAQLGDVSSLLERAKSLHPDLILLKANMVHCDCVNLIRRVRQILPRNRFMLMTEVGNEDHDDIIAAIEAGVRAIISRSIEPQDLLAAIRIVVSGGVIFATPTAGQMFDKLWSSLEASGSVDRTVWDDRAVPMALEDTGLSDREFEVLTLLAEGARNKEIAELLCITENTAKTHVRNILEKLQLHSRAHAAAYAERSGYVRVEQREKKLSPERVASSDQ